MFRTLVARELRGIFASPRFAATFAVCSLLVLLAVASGTVQYRAFVREQAALAALTGQEMSALTRWFSLRPRPARRRPAAKRLLGITPSPDRADRCRRTPPPART
jgi:hypothetical protein